MEGKEFITWINLLSTSYSLILYPFDAENPVIPLHVLAILRARVRFIPRVDEISRITDTLYISQVAGVCDSI